MSAAHSGPEMLAPGVRARPQGLATLATLGSSRRQPGRGGSGHLRQHGLALGELVGQQDELLIRVFDHAAANQQSQDANANRRDEIGHLARLQMGKLLELGRRAIELLNEDAVQREQRRASLVERRDLLGLLLAAREESDISGLTDREVRDEAMTIFLAGHETTSNVLSWAWYLLLSHPNEYEKVRAEAVSVLQGRTPTLADLPYLPHALRVLKETLRLYPPVYILGREGARKSKPRQLRQATQEFT